MRMACRERRTATIVRLVVLQSPAKRLPTKNDSRKALTSVSRPSATLLSVSAQLPFMTSPCTLFSCSPGRTMGSCGPMPQEAVAAVSLTLD